MLSAGATGVGGNVILVAVPPIATDAGFGHTSSTWVPKFTPTFVVPARIWKSSLSAFANSVAVPGTTPSFQAAAKTFAVTSGTGPIVSFCSRSPTQTILAVAPEIGLYTFSSTFSHTSISIRFVPSGTFVVRLLFVSSDNEILQLFPLPDWGHITRMVIYPPSLEGVPVTVF